MGEYGAIIEWNRGEALFTDNRYSRVHTWRFDGGIEIRASSSPQVVPVPMSDASAVDPEEAFVASLSSCHMLTFLYVAAKRGFVVDAYRDHAVGVMEKASAGSGGLWISRVTLRPATRFVGGQRPTADELNAMHHEAHEQCFIARSVRTDVRCEPVEE